MGNKGKISAAIITAALACCLPFIQTHEGESLSSYEDVVGVWTICHGITRDIKPGMMKTEAECDDLTRNTLAQYMGQVADLLKVDYTAEMLAAHTSFAYNIGVSGYQRSSALRLTNQGHFKEGCQAMMIWHTAGGKDCRVRSNNCYGVVTRRQDEISLCLAGIKP